MPLTLDKVEALSPDQTSLAAARKLLKAAAWPTLAAGEGLTWGECQGSGATPYRVVVAETDAGYKCTCPSRKFPCKHALALLWMRAEGKVGFAEAAVVPEWVKDWAGRRRSGGAPTGKEWAAAQAAEGQPKASLALLGEEAEEPADPRAEARAAAARERNRLEREESVERGLDELDLWLADQAERGLATFAAGSTQSCRLIAQRLVDAKAAGLASRVEAVPARLFGLPEAARPLAAVRELGQLHLIAEAYRRREALGPGLRADAMQAVGWTVTREALLADAGALRVEAAWRVVATLNEVQPDRLRRVETWLWSEGEPARAAVLVDFVPVATGAAASGYVIGDRLEATLVYYPSACPLRAQVERAAGGATATAKGLRLPELGLLDAYAEFEEVLAKLPWLGAWPLAFARAEVRRAGERLFLCDPEATLALPLAEAQTTLVRPLAGLGGVAGIGLWNGDHLTLCWAETPLGRWVHA